MSAGADAVPAASAEVPLATLVLPCDASWSCSPPPWLSSIPLGRAYLASTNATKTRRMGVPVCTRPWSAERLPGVRLGAGHRPPLQPRLIILRIRYAPPASLRTSTAEPFSLLVLGQD
jgi:hypothetical protein